MQARLLSLARNERRALGKPYLTADHTGTSCESDDQGSAGPRVLSCTPWSTLHRQLVPCLEHGSGFIQTSGCQLGLMNDTFVHKNAEDHCPLSILKGKRTILLAGEKKSLQLPLFL